MTTSTTEQQEQQEQQQEQVVDAVETLKRKVQDEEDEVVVEDEKKQKTDSCEDEGDIEAESVYPDTEEFFGWFMTGSEAGAFVAAHRQRSVDCALPLLDALQKHGVVSVYDSDNNDNDNNDNNDTDNNNNEGNNEDEQLPAMSESEQKELDELEDAKDAVNFAIEDSYCIVLQDFVPTESCPTEPESCVDLRTRVTASAESKTWIKLRVSREEPTADADPRIPVTVSVFDARKGLIIPKIGCWKWLCEVEAVEASVDTGLKTMMEKYC